MATKRTRRALLATATAGAAALTGAVVVKDRWDRSPPAEPLERRAGYREHKRACLEPRAGDGRREVRARSCRAWQEMLAQERERLAREAAAPARPAASVSEPR
jgi:hypothetical protein